MRIVMQLLITLQNAQFSAVDTNKMSSIVAIKTVYFKNKLLVIEG